MRSGEATTVQVRSKEVRCGHNRSGEVTTGQVSSNEVR